MKFLKKVIHPSLTSLEGVSFKRISARGVLIKDGKILMMFTQRYNDYTFPGGGVDSEEDILDGLKRELLEETGALDVEILKELGYIEDMRPYYKKEYDYIHEKSYFFLCIANKFTDVKLEDYEIRNGMQHLWIKLEDAISHNKKIMAKNPSSIGVSIFRETAMMEIIKDIVPELA